MTLPSLERVVVLRSPSSASGRVCEIPNGRFVEAKQENQWLDVRLLWSNPDGGFGSAAPVRRHRMQSFGCELVAAVGRHA